MSTLIHKDIQGTTEFDQDSNIFFGKLIGVNGVVMYEGEDANEFRKNFISAVDEYIEICIKHEIPIKKEFKGLFNVRTTPEIHEALNALCAKKNKKLNTAINEALVLYLESEQRSKSKRYVKRRVSSLRLRELNNVNNKWRISMQKPSYTYWTGDKIISNDVKIQIVPNPTDFVK